MKKASRRGPSVSEKLESARANRYKVIHERNLLILALWKHAGFEAHLVPSGTDAPGNWDKVLCLHTPAGQLHWKLSPKDAEDFEDILKFTKKSDWDKSRAAEKAERLERVYKEPSTLKALTEAVTVILDAFDAGIFVRDILRDGSPGWAVKLIKPLAALATAQRIVKGTSADAVDPQAEVLES